MHKKNTNFSKGNERKEAVLIQKVVIFALRYLSGIKRSTGESYAEHGLQVAVVLSELTTDPTLIRVAILHDLFLHPDIKKLLKKCPLSLAEKKLAREMHQIRRLFITQYPHDLRQFIDAFIKEERLLPLRMAHRLNDIRQFNHLPSPTRKQISKETLDIYVPIAARVGMHSWQHEMEERCFKVVHPQMAKKLENQFSKLKDSDEYCLAETESFLKEKLLQNGIHCNIQKRIKGLYSTYQKMKLKNLNFNEVTDRLALRIIVDDPIDCYRALDITHQFMNPIHRRFKDYIRTPKENSYQSIHTVVYPNLLHLKYPIEIQIRTRQMHEICQYGPAAHGDYKKGQYALNSDFISANLIKNIPKVKIQATNQDRFGEILKDYFDERHMVIFDAKRKTYRINKHTSALDFIKQIHSHSIKVKNIKLIKVNGRECSFNQPLKNGDTVVPEFAHQKQAEF